MTQRKENKRLQELFNKKIPVYSYSKLKIWNDCQYDYYQNYILKKRNKDNIYTHIGTRVHEDIEKIYHNETSLEKAKENFKECIRKSESKGICFPNNPPTIKTNYLKNMEHFYNNYIIKKVEMKTEQFVFYKIPRIKNAKNDEDYIWLQMYVDSIIPVYEDNKFKSVIVNDWKTSSKFSKKDQLANGRQLLIYKLGIEQMTGVPVSKVGWTMLKYAYACYTTKTNKVKKSMQQRKDVVKFLSKKIIKDLIDMGVDTLEAELKVAKMVNENSLHNLPEELKNKYWIEDCFLEYEFDDDLLKECNEWIIKTINEIEKAGTDIKNFKPKQIDKTNSFFCSELCGRPNCSALMKYKYENQNHFQKEKKENDINNILKNKIKLDMDKLFS